MADFKIKNKDGGYSTLALDDQIILDISGRSWGGNYEQTGVITTEQFFALKPFRDRVRTSDGEFIIVGIAETINTSTSSARGAGVVKTIYYGPLGKDYTSIDSLEIGLRFHDERIYDSSALGYGGSN